MAILKLEGAAIDKMLFIEREIEKAVFPYRENTEAAIVVCSLMRAARRLIRLYPDAVQADLVELSNAFLIGMETVEDTSATIIKPGGFLQ